MDPFLPFGRRFRAAGKAGHNDLGESGFGILGLRIELLLAPGKPTRARDSLSESYGVGATGDLRGGSANEGSAPNRYRPQRIRKDALPAMSRC